MNSINQRNRKKLLFFGDLAPKYLTGTSISSSLILKELNDKFEIIVVEENDSFQYSSLNYYKKLFNILHKCFNILTSALRDRIDTFYLVFSVSTFGSLKTLLILLSVKIINPRTKVITHIHRGDFFNSFYLKWRNRIITKLIFVFVKKVIVLSNSQLAEFKENFPGTAFSVLSNTLDIKQVQFEKASKYYSNKKLIFISNYFIEKGILDLLECVNALINEGYDIELDTYGKFSSDEVAEQIMQYSSSKIRIHSTIEEVNKYLAISKSDCLILPSWNEGQPLVILEAMAMATPIIATNVGLIPEMLGIDYKYLVSPNNQQMLKQKIVEFISDENVHLIGEILFERYCNNYSPSIHQKKVLEIFEVI